MEGIINKLQNAALFFSFFNINIKIDVEWFLAVHGAIKTELEENPRIKRENRKKVNINEKNSAKGFVGKGDKGSDSDDSEDDDDY